MKNLLILLLVVPILGFTQQNTISDNLFLNYETYKESIITQRRFKHNEIQPLIEKLKPEKDFQVTFLGNSIEGRSISMISIGSGTTNVLLWSQMHGDETTATMAIFDIFNYLKVNKEILKNIKLHFIPMLNPDGAEKFTRRNAIGIDINRDAIRLQSPESRILKSARDSLKADFGFNLHDQGRDYSVGNSFNPASISFLAPSPDYEKSITAPREKAMKLIGNMVNVLNEFIPGHIAKYSDDYEPRAFGDNFTKWGTGVVLLESGGWRGDREKQFLREINYIAILSALSSIVSNSYVNTDLSIYESIPHNEKFMMDFILRNLILNRDGKEYIIDIGINFEEVNINGARDFYLKASIEDLGDLSVYSGYDEIDLSGYIIEPGKTKPEAYNSLDDLEKIIPVELYKQGYTNVLLSDGEFSGEYSNLPFNIIIDGKNELNGLIKPDAAANFIIRKNDEVKYVIVNGFLIDIEKVNDWSGNTIVYRK